LIDQNLGAVNAVLHMSASAIKSEQPASDVPMIAHLGY